MYIWMYGYRVMNGMSFACPCFTGRNGRSGYSPPLLPVLSLKYIDAVSIQQYFYSI